MNTFDDSDMKIFGVKEEPDLLTEPRCRRWQKK